MTTSIEWIAAILGLCSLVTGVYAAWLWWRASKVAVAPAWPLQIGDNIAK